MQHKKTFHWQGLLASGMATEGTILAKNLSEARVALVFQGVTIVKIQRQAKSWQMFSNIKLYEVMLFTRQLCALLTTGIALVHALKLLGKAQKNTALKELVTQIKTQVEQGMSLHESLAKHSRYFDKFYCSLTQIGEQTGKLTVMLNQLANYYEKNILLKRKIRKALTYPIAVIGIAIAITAILLTKVIPQFETLFKQTNTALPLFTQWILHLSHYLQNQGGFILFVLLLGLISCYLLNRAFPKIQLFFAKSVLKIPIFGTLLKKTLWARFCFNLAICSQAGMPLVESLTLIAATNTNLYFKNAIILMREKIISGEPLQQAVQCSAFPSLLIQLVAVGEESGQLEAMLIQAGIFYEQEIDILVETLGTLLEPAIMVILGILIGGLIIAMYLPIFKIGQTF